MSKRLLITGSAGFIGFHLALALKRRGDFVVGLDNFNSYYPVRLKRRREELLKEAGIDVLQADICETEAIKALIQKESISHLVHLAAQAGVRYSIEQPKAYLHSNLEGFLSILEACRASPGVKLTYASSSSVYGLSKEVPFAVGQPTDRQASLYGATKKSNELMASTYHHLYGIPVTGLRYFTVYGPWGRPDMAYFSFSQAILEGRPLSVFNHGKLERDFTYIDDIVEGTAAAIDLGADCELFNLGNSRPVSLERFIALLEGTLGKKAVKNYLPMQPGDVLTTYADLSRSEKLLNYRPKTSLETGLSNFAAWYLAEKKSLLF